jgi:hypothetical protein
MPVREKGQSGAGLRPVPPSHVHRKPVFSWREIVKKDRALRQFSDRRTIRVNIGAPSR